MKKLTALIPARGGSKGVPKKNIKQLINHPLLAYSIIACRMSNLIDRIIVSTDDQEIADIAGKVYQVIRTETRKIFVQGLGQCINCQNLHTRCL